MVQWTVIVETALYKFNDLVWFVFIVFCSTLARSLGEAGEIEPETEGILIENGIDYGDFPPEVTFLTSSVALYWCIIRRNIQFSQHQICDVFSNLESLLIFHITR